MTADVPTSHPPMPARKRDKRHLAIRHWAEAERPRERLLERGSEALSDAELLAIFLRTGARGVSAIDLARDLIRHFGSLKNLMNATPTQLCALHGVKTARAATLLAVSELSRRILMERAREGTLLNSPIAVRTFLTEHIGLLIGGKPREVFVCTYLDARHKLLACEESAQGSLTRVAVYPREIVRRAIELNAAALIVAHNHLSGGAEPSAADHTT
ncbi:DNA repair protein RadC [Candidatus Burkholderia verschuerenii]|uniref:DNA repair protein RadC n=1 Tax=Candidatus Burkholderia verschuerenii TaxID=242163 RepID=A0A0L0M8R0_9BURK|nr:DNA repair protein RadC [Candidatus Burkholderia verschuerenii]